MLVNLSTDPGIDDVRCVQLTGKQGLVDTTSLTGWSNYSASHSLQAKSSEAKAFEIQGQILSPASQQHQHPPLKLVTARPLNQL